MSSDNTPRTFLRKKEFFQKLTILIAFLSFVVMLIGLLLQSRVEKRMMECNIVSSEELTSVSKLPGLTSTFLYLGHPVTRLIATTLECRNTGDISIVGRGDHRNLVGDGISFHFPKQSVILQAAIDSSDFPIEIEAKDSEFSLKFSQWHPKKNARLSFYVTSSPQNGSEIKPMTDNIDLINGSIVVHDLGSTGDITKKTVIERLPKKLQIMVYLVLTLLSIPVVLFGFFLFPAEVFKFFRKRWWIKKYQFRFRSFITDLDDAAISESQFQSPEHKGTLPKEEIERIKQEISGNPFSFIYNEDAIFERFKKSGGMPPPSGGNSLGLDIETLTLFLIFLLGAPACTLFIISNLMQSYYAIFK